MKDKFRFTVSALVWAVILFAAYAVAAQAQNSIEKQGQKQGKGTVTPQACCPLVQGSGTVGKIPKWSSFSGTNYMLGDSVMTESNGNIGIGSNAPNSKLSVQGMIETTLGGYKFPDGTVQTTAASGGLQSVSHNATLTGNGTQGSPLAVAVPLTLSGTSQNILTVVNTAGIQSGGTAISATGADTANENSTPGAGLVARGGNHTDDVHVTTFSGTGVSGTGGNNLGGAGGIGVGGVGGDGYTVGGKGVFGTGGGPIDLAAGGLGGIGVQAVGGTGAGAGSAGGIGLYAKGGAGVKGAVDGRAGFFEGAVEVHGNFNVTGGGTKNFKIDHPLDPENKYLYHAAIESSEVLNIYSGNITTDESGEATIPLPDWFEAINRDFRYQLTVVGMFAQAIVSDEVKGNQFKIKSNAPGVKVSWQVTGIRSDAAIRRHPFKVDEDKPQAERGSYLSPEAYDQPEERGIESARNFRAMQTRPQRKTVER